MAYLGIDTSYYTSSVALVDGAGRLLADGRRPLRVPPGERGVAPSQAVWAHVNALPELVEQVLAQVPANIQAVAASVAPRPQPGSYLPVFRVAAGYARALAAALRVPFYSTTHQEMHLMAGLWSAAAAPAAPEFLAVHLSGGTTELLRVSQPAPGCFAEQILGGTTDLHSGQFVDRVGVALGLPFPAGPHLERLAAAGTPGAVILPAVVRGRQVSFSGPETRARRLAGQARPEDLALAVFGCVARTVEKWLRPALAETGLQEVLVVGGVAANALLRARLRERLEHPAVGGRLFFAQPEYATDNAVGVAEIARRRHQANGSTADGERNGNGEHGSADR